MARPQYVYPKSKRWPIGDAKHAELAATYLLAGRGRPSEWPTVFKALQKHWPRNKEVQKLLDRYLRVGPPPSKRSKPNPMAKRKASTRSKKSRAREQRSPIKKAKPNPCTNPPKKKAKANPCGKGNPGRFIRIKGKRVGYDGPWQRLTGAPVALTKHEGLWTLTHVKSGLALRRFKTKARARSYFKRALKAEKRKSSDWNWSTWKAASKSQKDKAQRWAGV